MPAAPNEELIILPEAHPMIVVYKSGYIYSFAWRVVRFMYFGVAKLGKDVYFNQPGIVSQERLMRLLGSDPSHAASCTFVFVTDEGVQNVVFMPVLASSRCACQETIHPP